MADGTEDACIAGAVDGQKLRKAGELRKAREAFVTCSRIECPKEIGERCTTWLAEVEASVPSIVVSVQDSNDRDVLDAEVRIDGEARDVRSGKAVEVEPGLHRVEAKSASGAVQQDVVVREGERARLIRLVIALPAPPPPPDKPIPEPQPSKTFTYLAIGSLVTSAVATGFFIGFAAVGVADRDRFGCAKVCSASNYSQVKNEFLAADTMIVVAGVTLAAGVVFWLLSRPSKAAAQSAGFPTLVRW
jgi:hypothetical protein